MTALDQASAAMTPGQAVRNVFNRYEVVDLGAGLFAVRETIEQYLVTTVAISGHRAECQAWIYHQAFAAGLRAVPVSDAVVEAAAASAGQYNTDPEDSNSPTLAAVLGQYFASQGLRDKAFDDAVNNMLWWAAFGAVTAAFEHVANGGA